MVQKIQCLIKLNSIFFWKNFQYQLTVYNCINLWGTKWCYDLCKQYGVIKLSYLTYLSSQILNFFCSEIIWNLLSEQYEMYNILLLTIFTMLCNIIQNKKKYIFLLSEILYLLTIIFPFPSLHPLASVSPVFPSPPFYSLRIITFICFHWHLSNVSNQELLFNTYTLSAVLSIKVIINKI